MTPPFLKHGDSVAIVATARKISPDEVAPAISILQSWGLNVVIPEGLFAVDNQFAGSDSHRAALLQSMLDDNSVRAVFCARGGYGTVRILDRLGFSHFRENPKWIVGYSDVTALHSHVAKLCNLPTLHAIMPINFPDNTTDADCDALNTLHQFLFGEGLALEIPHHPLNRLGSCSAPIVGGNLSILYSLLASPSDVDTDGKILMIEDLDEYLYHIDRMMWALRRAGKLARLKGLLVGRFTSMHDNEVPFGSSVEKIVLDAVGEYHYPVAFNCPFGHIGTENCALPLGIEIKMEVNSKGLKLSV